MIEQLSKLCDGPVNKKLLKYEKKNKNLESLRNLALKQVTHRKWRTRDPGQRTNIPYTKKKKKNTKGKKGFLRAPKNMFVFVLFFFKVKPLRA